MQKRFLFITLIALLTVACGKNTNISIKGSIRNTEEGKVYLEQINVDNVVLIDSTIMDKSGGFVFKLNSVDGLFYNLKFPNNQIITIFAQPNDKLKISGDLNKLMSNYWVDGSEHSLWIKVLNFQINNTRIQMDSIRTKYKDVSLKNGMTSEIKSVIIKWDSILDEQKKFSRDFILKHATSPSSYFALYQKFDNKNFILDPIKDLQSYKIVASSLSAIYPNSIYTKAIMCNLKEIYSNIKAAQLKNIIDNSEARLPMVKLPDVKGDTISLGSLKDKFILLDFTMLTAKDSKPYIDDLKSIYQKYKYKNFIVYQVCLDSNVLFWKESIKDYGINWICVRDNLALKSTIASNWNVKSIPANYLINDKFEIVGKNLYGRALEDRLNDLLK